MILEKIVSVLRSRLMGSRADTVEHFVRQYYHGASVDDLRESEPGDLFGAAMGTWNFLQQRTPGADKVRVFNPNREVDGWSSPHTVVEAVTDDRPFLVASLTALLTRGERGVWRVFHPIIQARRDDRGNLHELLPPGSAEAGSIAESVMHFEITFQPDEAAHADIARQVHDILADVRVAVEDWGAMRQRLRERTDELKRTAPGEFAGDLAEVIDFLNWLAEDNFTFLGYREARLAETPEGPALRTLPDTGLGLLRDPGRHVLVERDEEAQGLPAKLVAELQQPGLLFVIKADKRSTVHRPVHMDLIRVKRFDDGGRVTGGWGFAGLFTAAAYNLDTAQIPLLRRKTQRVFERSGFAPDSHAGRAFANVLETYPRDELFQIDEDSLLENALAMMHLQWRPRVRLLARRDSYERFMSCLVFLPRDRYDSDLKARVLEILEEAFDGQVSLTYTNIGDSPLARLHVIVKTRPGALPAYDIDAVEQRLAAAARRWTDALREALFAHGEEHQASRLWQRYENAFPDGYRERYEAETALYDINYLERVAETGRLALNLYRLPESPAERLGFKTYTNHAVVLSDVLPVLENMGFRVIGNHPYRLQAGADDLWINDFQIEDASGQGVELRTLREKFHNAFAAIWYGEAENDGFNALVPRAGLSWREVAILRAYAKYLHQVPITFSQAYLERTLNGHPGLAARLIKLFGARCDPDRADEGEAAAMAADFEQRLDDVANLDEDRILRRFLNLVQATLRTNYYQTDERGNAKAWLSFKLDSQAVLELPPPRPMVEIFVYAPHMEGIHLRGGKVARGGIRWSDRPEDFRTEILGLVKAQMVKNAVIVPVGSKGGFIAKALPAGGDREAVTKEVVACYATLMRGMLDITDNIVAGAVVHPQRVVRHDGDDPYLVVAADKGTATFSDIANGIAEEYGFWLGDAFASGGSAGYDHKKMGITARGAWEAVKRHFREIGVDILSAEFTVAGIGDMGGDVFGNGMLLSPHIRLVGAFNHQHIFLDPNPDAAKSFAERKRIFDLPRSTWLDYDKSLISAGGGVFERRAKSIALTPEVRELLGVDAATLTPNEVIRAMLRAPVDLLWNGGIGTYVKASVETHADVGDKANDAVRVDGRDLRCKVVGEGGNLGLTQRGRIEAALNGVRLNTDAIDNSAGVDCSDHEVNLKVLLNGAVADGTMTRVNRDKLLAAMTDEVADLVLRDNYLQTQAISAVAVRGIAHLDRQARMMQTLERAGLLDRAVEFLPDEEILAERRAAGLGLVRPEIAVLLSYAKMWVYQQLLQADLPDDPYLESDLVGYFPKALHHDFLDRIRSHQLRREIIATVVTNSLINRTSLTFPTAARDETGADVSLIARAFVVARDAFRMRATWADIEALDNLVPASVQMDMVQETRRLLAVSSLWFLRNLPQPMHCVSVVADFEGGIAELAGALDTALTEESRTRLNERRGVFLAAGVPEPLAERIAGFDALISACDIVQIARKKDLPVVAVARTYFDVGARVHLDWLRHAAQRIPMETHWQRQAVYAIVDDLYGQQKALTMQVIDTAGRPGDGAVEDWAQQRSEALGRSAHLLADLRAMENPDLAMLAVANHHLRGLVTV